MKKNIQHRQDPLPVGKNSKVKYCPSCGNAFSAGELHSVHDPKQCRLILRARRKANLAAAGLLFPTDH